MATFSSGDPRGLSEHPPSVLDDGEDEGQVHCLEAFVREVERPRVHHPEVQIVHTKLRPPPVGSFEHAGAEVHPVSSYPHGQMLQLHARSPPDYQEPLILAEIENSGGLPADFTGPEPQ